MKKLWILTFTLVLICSAVNAARAGQSNTMERPWRTMSDQRLEQEIQRGIDYEPEWLFDLLVEFYKRHFVDPIVFDYMRGWVDRIDISERMDFEPGTDIRRARLLAYEDFYRRHIEIRDGSSKSGPRRRRGIWARLCESTFLTKPIWRRSFVSCIRNGLLMMVGTPFTKRASLTTVSRRNC